MKKMTPFEEAIKTHLEERASGDPLFAPFYNNPKKNLSECCTYILNTVKASSRQGFSSDEIFSMAIHYHTEENISVGKPISNVRVVVNKSIPLSGEKQPKITEEKPIVKKKSTKPINELFQQSLFDEL